MPFLCPVRILNACSHASYPLSTLSSLSWLTQPWLSPLPLSLASQSTALPSILCTFSSLTQTKPNQPHEKLHVPRRPEFLHLHPQPSFNSLHKARCFSPLRQANLFHADIYESLWRADAQILFRHWHLPACSILKCFTLPFNLPLALSTTPSQINLKKHNEHTIARSIQPRQIHTSS